MAEGETPKGPGGSGKSSQAVRQVADAIAKGLVNGRSVDELTSDLESRGWKQDDARTFVTTIDQARRGAQKAVDAKPTLRRGLLMHIVLGILWIVAGVTLMLTATPQRDLSSMGVAVIAFGVIEGAWAVRGWKAMK